MQGLKTRVFLKPSQMVFWVLLGTGLGFLRGDSHDEPDWYIMDVDCSRNTGFWFYDGNHYFRISKNAK